MDRLALQSIKRFVRAEWCNSQNTVAKLLGGANMQDKSADEQRRRELAHREKSASIELIMIENV